MTLILKTLLHLIQPLSIIWLVIGLWLVRRIFRRRSPDLWFPGAAWLLLTLLTCTPFASWLISGLEDQVPRVKLADLPQTEAIVCLGGGFEPSLVEPSGFKLQSGADRLTTALTLTAESKAPLLILGGGGYPHEGRVYSEADAVSDYLRAHVTLKAELLSMGVCKDTHDEAVKVAALAKERGLTRLLLVTSANHMPRTLATFRKAGINVIPVPCNYLNSLNHLGELHYLHLPSPRGLEVFGAWLHETVGSWVYRWRGWV
ncbi:YdcF family protein [Prosthecobacter sp.]|uniref:YdcF family protein n=1 Tax=Prosthecobacter sp. TaxID=1965333 RepID=UPI003784EACF